MNYLVNRWKDKYEKAAEENKLLKDNEYVQKVEEENQELRRRLNAAFEISPEVRKKMVEWQQNHFDKKHSDKRMASYHYEFYPTAIGTFGDYVCDYCKEKFNIGEV